jgi:hypothetical protein
MTDNNSQNENGNQKVVDERTQLLLASCSPLQRWLVEKSGAVGHFQQVLFNPKGTSQPVVANEVTSLQADTKAKRRCCGI